MICPNCGSNIADNALFCTKCGTKIERTEIQGTSGDGKAETSEVIEINNITTSGNVDHKPKEPFVWKDQYTYIAIGVGILLAAIIGFAVKTTKSAESGQMVSNENAEMTAEESDLKTEQITASDHVQAEEESTAENDYAEEDSVLEDEELSIDEEQSDELFDDVGVHTYELIVSDVTWTEAYEQCLRMGGHLVRINSDEECNVILNQIYSEGKEKIKFWVGGYRDENDDYRWVYNDSYEDRFPLIFGDVVINSDPMYKDYWLDGEPSLYDETIQSNEDRMNMFYMKSLDRWVWNDVPDDVLSVASFYSGSMGYICEYE